MFMTTMAAPQNVHTNFKQGHEGEATAAAWLKQNGWLCFNVSRSDYYRKKDIDLFCFKSADGERQIAKIEVKNDNFAHKSGNLVFETVSNTSKDTLGWTLYSEADYFLIVSGPLMYIIPGKETVEWFSSNYDRFREITVPTVFNDGEKTRYFAKARLVPQSTFDEEVGIIEVVDLREMGLYPAQAS